ncbi:protein FAM219A isoform X3 [Latimeria chalumnae]|uniref:protein FAM219A isoform X3 n=1 Tax=Latimeria chalumnae TaxID=7897 RepID=UPI00313B2CF1
MGDVDFYFQVGSRRGFVPCFLTQVFFLLAEKSLVTGSERSSPPNGLCVFVLLITEKQRELARKGSVKNGNVGSPVNQQPKKNNVMARTRLVVPNKGYSSLDQSPDEKPLVALDTDSDDDFDMSRYSSSGYSSAEINQDLNIQLLKDGYRLDEIPDDEDLDLIPPKSVNPTCMCCQATSSTACHIQ